MVLPLHHERSGSGPPLVLVHGLGSNLRIWHPIRTALARSHEVVALDLPGFGESPSLPAAVRRDVPSLVSALEEWLDERGIGEPHVAGNSMGGLIALELAARGRARSAVAISPAGFGSRLENKLTKVTLRTQRVASRALAPVAGHATRSPAGRAVLLGVACARPWRIPPAEAAHMLTDFARAPGLRRTLDPLLDEPPRDLETIRCPVAVLWGTRDLILPVAGASRVQQRIPHAQVHRLPGLGHIPTFDDPETVAERILEVTAGSE